MNREKIKGKIEEIKGDLKHRFGGAFRSRKTQAEGSVEEKKGQIRRGVGEMEERAERERQLRREEPEHDG